MESINRSALELVDEALDFTDSLGIEAFELDSGATVLDFGIDAPGGIEAGLFLAEIQTAGLASVHTTMRSLAGSPRPYVELTTDSPGIALLCSQKAGWELDTADFNGLGSGPARALARRESEFDRMGYYDKSDFTVLSIESDAFPDDRIVEHISELTGVQPTGIFLPVHPSASTVGSVTMASRAAELAAFRLSDLGYDPMSIKTASGAAPMAPVSDDETIAMGRTNDALAYGAEVFLQVDEEFARFDEVASTATEEYGTPFVEIFEDADWDFYEVPESVFAPAKVTIDVLGGDTHVIGETNETLLAESFDLP
ncbi:methenyltetrahydromethanopterin cyclohydrolase [Halalkalirubrum salinum]|uniref:methenyltetrahydromethanopterin cyclohydrolase n=1 Tax=Halalkalirubrum salinum TaxID=2563889 RepID=UPI0010FAEA9A|nr:methenyltetrahydromethanopterin cyclohydrolase [Halalkalirubrum salinum]